MSAIEWIATAFGVACVILTIRQSVWCWPTGLVQVFLYIFVFAQARLYSDVILHVIYVALSIYGWWAWMRGGAGGSELAVSRASPTSIGMWTAIALVATIGIGAAMRKFTQADRPFWDAAVLVLSLIAQWLMARKTLESWLFWIAVDVLAIGLYAVKGLYPTTALYAVFLALAITGFFQWKRSTTSRPSDPGEPGELQPA